MNLGLGRDGALRRPGRRLRVRLGASKDPVTTRTAQRTVPTTHKVQGLNERSKTWKFLMNLTDLNQFARAAPSPREFGSDWNRSSKNGARVRSPHLAVRGDLVPKPALLRHSNWDGLLVFLAVAQGCIVW